jgi:subtilase family serine protease
MGRRPWAIAGAAAAAAIGLVAYAVTGAAAVAHHAAGAGRLTAAQAGATGAAQAPSPPITASAPGTGLPGALPVAAPHTGKGWMSNDLMVRVPKWTGGKANCTPTTQALPDTQSAHPVTGGCGATARLAAASPPGYGATQLRAYLRLRGTGAGQSVAIVDPYDNPYVTRDIKIYSKQFGLPLPCPAKGSVPGCFRFSVARPFGIGGLDPGSALESDLDVQMVHAIAPQASITLVEAHDNSITSLFQAIDYAAGLNPTPAVISNSWGSAEFPAETSGDQHCALSATLCVFSSGDTGNPARYPASNPYVLAVGGTSLQLSPAGQVQSEVAWCCINQGGTGGGMSQYEPRPAYQDAVNPYQGRGTPDVSFDADPYTGVAVHDTVGLDGQNGWIEVGGTSVGAPAWSGIVAAADQLRARAHKAPLAGAGFAAQKLIYGMPHRFGFGDITHGVNNIYQCNAAEGTPVTACQAKPGYDLVTGWGSPRPGIDTALASTR